MTTGSDPLLAHHDKLLKAMDWAAQFESMQRQHREEMACLLSGMLDVLDSLHALRRHLDDLGAEAGPPLPLRSVEVIARQMLQRLATVGVEPIEANGRALDLAIHEVVGTRPTVIEEDQGRVLEEVTAGFHWRRRLLRRSKVIIGQAETDPT